VPVIDLDSPSQVASSRTLRWHPRWLIIMATVVALLGVPGEPDDTVRSFDMATVCGHFSAEGAVILDVETGEVLRALTCPS
jgi:hypothetical protein